MSLTPEAIQTSIDRLRIVRHRLVMTIPPPSEDGSLVPILERSAEVCAIDNALLALKEALKGVAQ